MSPDEAYQQIEKAIQSGRPANGYLLVGGVRGSANDVAERVLKLLFGDGDLRAHPDIHRLAPEMKSRIISVEAMRTRLIDPMGQTAFQGGWKVGVVYAADRLKTESANAFLKTLEEPPEYVTFILATTEKHKIIPTILSRCQIYDFSRISNRDIVAHLQSVAEKEGVTAEQAALDIIAEKSDGGMRDALSIFDQVVSFTGGQVTYEKTIENLNVIDYDYYFNLTDMFLEKRIPDSLLLLNDILSKGFDASHLISGLMLHLRNLMVSRDACTLPLLQVSDEMRERYSKQAARCQPKFLFRALKICNDCDLNYRISKNKRLLVELALIQIAQSDEDDDSHGRKPTRLKPIFKKNAAPQQAAPAPAKSQTAAMPVEPKPATQVTPKPAATSAVPTFKGGVFTSIYGNGAGRPDQVHGRQTVKVIMQENDVPAKPLTEDLLQMRWTQFAAGLGRQDTPLKNRMVNCIPLPNFRLL